MKSKVWNKLFHKNKTTKSSSLNNSGNQNQINFNNIDDVNAPENNDESIQSNNNDEIQFNENFKICNTLNAKQKESSKNLENFNENFINYSTLPSSSKNSKSKLSKMVNSLTLKRNNNNGAAATKKENILNSDDYKNDIAISLIRNESERNNNYGYNNSCENNDFNNMYKMDEINSNNETKEILINNNITNTNNNYKIITSLEYDNKPVLGLNSDNSSADTMAEEHPVNLKLRACPICCRTFVPKTLEKHITVCEKMQAKKRRVFDSSRQRREGTELASYVVPPIKPLLTVVENKPSIRQSIVAAPKEDPIMQRQPSVNRQQRKSVSPVKAIDHQQIKQRAAAKRTAAQPVERCQYCDRTFGIKAYDRHVEWCKEKAKINAMKKPSEASKEKNRLDARTKYKAPNLKLKRNEVREKYCFDDGRTDENCSISTSLSSSFVSDGRKDSRSVQELEAICENKSVKEQCLLKKSATFSNETKSSHNTKEIISGEMPIDGKIIKEIILPLPLPKISSYSQQLIKSNSFHSNEYQDDNFIRGDRLLNSLKKSKSSTTMLPPIETKCVSILDIQTLLKTSDFICDNIEKIRLLDGKNSTEIFLNKLHNVKNFKLEPNPNNKLSLLTENGCVQQSTKEDILQNYFKRGYSDKYDPFLSAKRQLEELCSPYTNKSFNYPNKYISPITTPTTPKFPINSCLTTSAYSSGKNSINPRQSLNTVKSNFRRTSSLRSPRRQAPCSRPLFVPPSSRLSRPTTIQRGISDEGPISTNFIKPEEYDEMPVKSACVNNYAISINSPKFIKRDPSPKVPSTRQASPRPVIHQLSPRITTPEPMVIKREPSSSLNRRNLRLNLNDESSGTTIPINKTDSLAIFLKYENDLEKLNNNINENLITLTKSDVQINPLDKIGENAIINTNGRPGTTTKSSSSSSSTIISEKELKDKTNIISKQNSLKNSSNDLAEKTFNFNDKDKLPLIKNNSGNLDGNKIIVESLTISKIHPIKLEPLPKSITIKNNQYQTSNHSQQIASDRKSQKPQHSLFSTSLVPIFPILTKETSVDDTISLNSILSNNKISKDSDNFIDPKLINVCDNLPINTIKSSDSDLVSNSSQDSAQTTKESPIKHESMHFNKKLNSIDVLNNNNIDIIRTTNNSNRNSAEKKSLMKRQIRLGRNQFLFDANPSDEDESSPPMINKSIETIVPLIDLSDDKQFDSLLSPSNNPIFNNFDFEEFLSSFENNNNDDDDDGEKFPGFKDCKEFLLNRTRKIRSKFEIKNSPINFNRSHKYDLNQSVMLGETNSSEQDERNREIFISIETNDQNDNATLINPCPNNPDIIKNPKVEEINLNNDNKFTKIETYHLPVYDEEEKDEMNLLNDFVVDDVLLMNRNNMRNKRNRSHRSDNPDDDDFDKTCESSHHMYPNDSDEISSVECFPVSGRNMKSKTNADSAYGSLSRHSPTSTENSSLNRNSSGQQSIPSNEQYMSNHHQQQQQQQNHQLNRKLSASSSSSENLLPHLNDQSSENLSTRSVSKMSKFCHECGSKFLIDTAKFCMECGIKRMLI